MLSYDRVHYPRLLYHVTRPDHLELMGWLHGLDPRPAPSARVLEIGCGVGDNLILAGECFPGARFVGIDLSPSQIAAGEALRAAAGAQNVELRALDLTRLDGSFGEFDYIVAHGVYSWVPEPVREALLEVIRARLAPGGVAFFSHHVFPGHAPKAMARGIMRFRARGIADPGEQARVARRFLGSVVAGASPGERLYRAVLAERATITAERSADVLYHDDLSEVCDGEWFWETAERLAAHGLQFLVDAETEMLGPTGLGADALRAVDELATNVIDREQHLDFLRNRALRLTLACHASATLERALAPAKVFSLHVSLDPQVAELELKGATLSVRTRSTQLTVADAVGLGVLDALGRAWPGSLPFADLPGAERERVGARVLELFRLGVVALSPRPPTFAATPPARPRACALARVQASAGSLHLANLRHTHSQVDDAARRALVLLDGSRDHVTLARQLGLADEAVEALLARLCMLALIHAG